MKHISRSVIQLLTFALLLLLRILKIAEKCMYFSFQHQYLFPSSLSKDSNILYVLYVHFVQSDNALLAKSTAHNERASSIYGTDVYTYICSTYNRTERAFTNYIKQQNIKTY